MIEKNSDSSDPSDRVELAGRADRTTEMTDRTQKLKLGLTNHFDIWGTNSVPKNLDLRHFPNTKNLLKPPWPQRMSKKCNMSNTCCHYLVLLLEADKILQNPQIPDTSIYD